MKHFNKKPLLAPSWVVFSLLTGCGVFSTRDYVPVPAVSLPPQPVVDYPVYEARKVKKVVEKLEELDAHPIYLYIEDHNLTNQSAELDKVPRNFRIMAMGVLAEFGDKVEVYTSVPWFETLLKSSPEKRPFAFEVEGAITAYDTDLRTIDTGADFGLEFGGGKGEASHDTRFRDYDRTSRLTIEVFFKNNGKIYKSARGTIDITEVNRGYSFGLRINNSGIGLNAYSNKKQGIGDSMRKVLYTLFSDLIGSTTERTMYGGDVNGVGVKQSKVRPRYLPENSLGEVSEEERVFLESLK